MTRAVALSAIVAEWRSRPFTYGSSDCLQFAGAAVAAIRGIDYRAAFPSYRSDLGAARILRRCGGVAGIVAGVLGEAKPVAWAGRGDLVVGDFGLNGTEAVAVCLGRLSCLPGESGLVFVETARARLAWSV